MRGSRKQEEETKENVREERDKPAQRVCDEDGAVVK